METKSSNQTFYASVPTEHVWWIQHDSPSQRTWTFATANGPFHTLHGAGIFANKLAPKITKYCNCSFIFHTWSICLHVQMTSGDLLLQNADSSCRSSSSMFLKHPRGNQKKRRFTPRASPKRRWTRKDKRSLWTLARKEAESGRSMGHGSSQ